MIRLRIVSVLTAAVLTAAACSGAEATPGTTAAPVTTAVAGGIDLPLTGDCEALFGSPTASTGLDETVCRPERICDGLEPFLSSAYSPDVIDGLASAVLANPPALLPASPYEDPSLVPTETGGVCAVFSDGAGYRLETLPGAAEAEAAGGVVTMAGPVVPVHRCRILRCISISRIWATRSGSARC